MMAFRPKNRHFQPRFFPFFPSKVPLLISKTTTFVTPKLPLSVPPNCHFCSSIVAVSLAHPSEKSPQDRRLPLKTPQFCRQKSPPFFYISAAHRIAAAAQLRPVNLPVSTCGNGLTTAPGRAAGDSENRETGARNRDFPHGRTERKP